VRDEKSPAAIAAAETTLNSAPTSIGLPGRSFLATAPALLKNFLCFI
jgi:hypothetical protein